MMIPVWKSPQPVFITEYSSVVERRNGPDLQQEIQNQVVATESFATGYDHSVEYYPFDPNDISLTQWKSFGVSEKTATTILNYLATGARFYAPQDLLKIYGFDQEIYQQIEPYIMIGQPKDETSDFQTSTPIVQARTDINQADSVGLTLVRGIGPVYASRIVKYRNLLGGFHLLDQLTEVYGITDEVYAGLVDQLTISQIDLEKMDLNMTDVKELASHPYIDWNQAEAIVNYRNNHGSFLQLEELLEIYVLDQDWLERISPYLKL